MLTPKIDEMLIKVELIRNIVIAFFRYKSVMFTFECKMNSC